MDRASRFIWEMSCGRKDRKLFKKAIKTLSKVIEKTEDLSLVTDGERRYGNLLFDICHELLKTGKRGRPRKTLKKGVKVRVKNKGDQKHKKGRKRSKYQAPHKEHPQTEKNLKDSQIQANHVEAFNASLRRKCAAYRRKTNTYAKKTKRLQQRLDVLWIVHNFIRTHFTTQSVPVVAIGILDRSFTYEDIFSIKYVSN